MTGRLCLAGLFLIVPCIAGAQTYESGGTGDGVFQDLDGHWRSFDRTNREWFGPHRQRPHYLRAAAESGIELALGLAYYWAYPHANASDWDYPNPFDRLTTRIIRFDNNTFAVNNLMHPAAGIGYYGLPRVNGLPIHEAFLYVFAASTIWEYALEWREKVSINDMVFTPFGGLAMGEVTYQLGEYVNSVPGHVAFPNLVAQVVVGWPRLVHDLADDPPRPVALPADALGFSSAFWHRFWLAYGLGEITNESDERSVLHGVALETEIVSMPGFLRPGRFETFFGSGNFTETRMRFDVAEGELQNVDLWFDTEVVGYYDQQFRPGRNSGLRGSAGLLAITMALRYVDRRPLGRRDQLAVAHFAGLRIGLWLAHDDVLVMLQGDVRADFASVRSLAFPSWQDLNGSEGVRSVLDQRGYYYGLGGSSRLGVRVALAGFEIGSALSIASYSSLDGLDRHEEEVWGDPALVDQVFEYGAWAGWGPARTPLRLRLAADDIVRWSAIGPTVRSRTDRRVIASAGLEF